MSQAPTFMHRLSVRERERYTYRSHPFRKISGTCIISSSIAYYRFCGACRIRSQCLLAQRHSLLLTFCALFRYLWLCNSCFAMIVIYRLYFLVCIQDTYVRQLMNAWSGQYSLADLQVHRKIPINHAASVRTSFAFAEFELSPTSTASCKRPWRSCFVFVGRSEIPRRQTDVVTLCWRRVGLRPESLVVGALGWAHLGAEPRYGPMYLGRTGGVGEIRGYVLSCNEGRLHDGTSAVGSCWFAMI